MKSSLKSIVKGLLFPGRDPVSFPAVRIPTGQVQERFILISRKTKLDVTVRHCIACHSPFCLAAWITNEELGALNPNHIEANTVNGEKLNARIELSLMHQIQQGDHQLVILQASNAENFQLGKIRQSLMRRYFRNKNSKLEDKLYAAAYSFPRRVIAVSFRDGDYYNIFPMDFQCFLKEAGMHVFGLRTTNVTLARILEKKQVVVGDTDQADIKALYALGNHHSSSPPEISNLPFEVIDSEKFHFPVPAFSAGYKEIELTGNLKLGTHMLFFGKIVNSREMREWKSSIHHIHFFHSFDSNYPMAR